MFVQTATSSISAFCVCSCLLRKHWNCSHITRRCAILGVTVINVSFVSRDKNGRNNYCCHLQYFYVVFSVFNRFVGFDYCNKAIYSQGRFEKQTFFYRKSLVYFLLQQKQYVQATRHLYQSEECQAYLTLSFGTTLLLPCRVQENTPCVNFLNNECGALQSNIATL